ncbi:hypothetical protein FACS1894193_00960 [Bacilli bacterium]|nr:hypothetical protein FACS1894193_00960 [Bacilli bacterium]
MNSISAKSQVLGNLLIYLLKLQAFFLAFTFLGGVILGIFPSIATVIDYLIHSLDKKQDNLKLTFSTFKTRWQSYFKTANILGFSLSAIFLFLMIDLQVSKNFLHSLPLHLMLFALLVLFLGISCYLFPSLSRYDLMPLQHLKQAAFLFLANLITTVAMLAGLLLASALMTLFPILVFIGLVPLLLLPIAHFSLQAMCKVEDNHG